MAEEERDKDLNQQEHFDSGDEEYLEYEEILDEYRRRQMIEHLTGPMISIVLHAAVIIILAIFMVGKPPEVTEAVMFETKEMEVKPVDPKTQEELDEIEEDLDEPPVPPVEKPDITPEEVQTEATSDFDDAMAASDTDLEVDAMLETPTRSRLAISGIFGNRTKRGRDAARRRHGGSMAAERAVIKALEWLKRNQKEDGSWEGGEAHTGLGLLTFLAHGETHESDRYGETVTKAMKWLTDTMMDKPRVGGRPRGYINGISTYALAEAYGLTKLPLVKPAMEKGLRFIVNGQMKEGGWGYGYTQGDRWDLSVAGWQLQALKAGKAAGADVAGIDEAMEKGVDWLKNINFNSERGIFYYSPGRRGSGAMQGAGTLCLQLLGEGRSSQAKTGLEWIEENYNHDYAAPSGRQHYEWYYQTQAMFHGGTRYFRPWNNTYAPMLVKNQEEDGHWEAFKNNNVYSTTLCALSLQVYYRYLPTYKEIGHQEQKKSALGDLEVDIY